MSLLHRDKSKGEDSDPRRSTDKANSLSPSVTTDQTGSPARSSLNLSQTVSHDNLAAVSRQKSRPGAAGGDSNSTIQPAASSKADKSPTVEQSVRIFRLFEALRSGDTVAISKAIRDSVGGESDTRKSISSVTSVREGPLALEGTSLLHLAVQCAEQPVIEYILSSAESSDGVIDVNGRDRDGNTPLHLAASLGRSQIVRLLLRQPAVNDSIINNQGRTPLDVARTPEIFQQLQLSKSLFIDATVKHVHQLISKGKYDALEKLIAEPRVQANLDLNGGELVTDPVTAASAGTLLHEGARKRDTRLIQILLLNGADPFRRDKKGKLPQDVTKDERTRGVLKRSPAAAAAQRGIQEKTVLGSSTSQAAIMNAAAGGATTIDATLAGKESREIKGYLKKWTNYTTGYKLRWFVLEDGVLSYYKHQDDVASACRGAINMRIAKLYMDPQDKQRFEILGKSSVKYHLKANHVVEAKRWFWTLNNAIQWAKDEARAEEGRRIKSQEAFNQAKNDELERTEQLDKSKTPDGTSDSISLHSSRPGQKSAGSLLGPASRLGPAGVSSVSSNIGEEDDAVIDSREGSLAGPLSQVPTRMGDDETQEGDYADDGSSQAEEPHSRDAFDITAQSAKLQLDLLSTVSGALNSEKAKNPNITITHPTVTQALSAYDTGIRSLHGLVVDLLKIARDRESYWQGRMDREVEIRKLWEENMARLAKQHEELEGRMEETEDKRKKTKRALREVLQEGSIPGSRQEPASGNLQDALSKVRVQDDGTALQSKVGQPPRRKSTFAEISQISDTETDDEEFFDAVDAGEIEVLPEIPVEPAQPEPETKKAVQDQALAKENEIETSFKGYEEPPRKKLLLDDDDRPVISLWVCISN
jgi:ankyrin repeat protein